MKPELESDLRSALRDERRFPLGCITFTEYAKGGDAGAPDCWFAGDGRWNPLELKKGADPRPKLRPSQVRWHKDSLTMGIPTYLATLHQGQVIQYRLKIVKSQLMCDPVSNHSVDEYDIHCVRSLL